ncbi:MAG: TIGR02452 family protein [Clostridia bacterium]|nr:TIGR02452 family protein [Clostridia bacterium]
MYFQKYVNMLNETLNILEKGRYAKKLKRISLKLSAQEMRRCTVYLPDDLRDIAERGDFVRAHGGEPLAVGCENTDSFSKALALRRDLPADEKILVLNFANPFRPGGGVRLGAMAQEEDLCRRSSLLLSLESEEASRYYMHNLSLQTYLSSHAVMITPDVEIIRDCYGRLLDETAVVSVMTCAAPIMTPNREGLTQGQYEALFYERICGMLVCAAHLGYRTLVLGAIGCGAFGNDAEMVSDLFCRAIRELDFGGAGAKDIFRRIEFAVMDHSSGADRFRAFHRNFGEFIFA